VLVFPKRAIVHAGQIEELPIDLLPAFDPECYLCPGNELASRCAQPVLTDTFVFEMVFQRCTATLFRRSGGKTV